MIVGVCGFSWSGSGAVMDYLMQYDNLQIYKRELTIAYFPDGIGDLDFHLNENCAKFLSSTVAIPRFKKMTKRILKRPTKGAIDKLVDDYIESLVQSKWIGAGQGQLVLHNQWFYWHVGNRLLHRTYRKISPDICTRLRLYPLTEMELSICPDSFIEKTQLFTDNLLVSLGLDVSKTIVLNQAFPANNPKRFLRYFRESKAIVVDRDPRDVFVFLSDVFRGNSYSVPFQNVEEFVKYYRALHNDINKYKKEDNILYLRFEDLIYEYEKTINKINSFLGLDKLEKDRILFVPEQSMINTRVFENSNISKNDLEYIEQELPEYLFDFEKYEYKPSISTRFDDNPLTK